MKRPCCIPNVATDVLTEQLLTQEDAANKQDLCIIVKDKLGDDYRGIALSSIDSKSLELILPEMSCACLISSLDLGRDIAVPTVHL